MKPRLFEKYKNEVVPELQKKFNIKNCMAVPRLEKIVINMGVGQAIHDMKIMESAMQDLTIISGQKPIVRRAKKAISNFKLRKGLPVGCKVTLRKHRMYEFFDRFVNVCLPRIRDFRGMPLDGFDRQGNYNLGIADQAIFPEIDSGKLQKTQGMDIAFVFDKGPQEQTFELLRLLGMPFSKT